MLNFLRLVPLAFHKLSQLSSRNENDAELGVSILSRIHAFVFTCFFWESFHELLLSFSPLILRASIALFFGICVSIEPHQALRNFTKSLFFGGCSSIALMSMGPLARFNASLTDADAIAVEETSEGTLSGRNNASQGMRRRRAWSCTLLFIGSSTNVHITVLLKLYSLLYWKQHPCPYDCSPGVSDPYIGPAENIAKF